MKKLLEKIKIVAVSIVLNIISIFVKRSENIIALGSWTGELYADNSKYFFEYMLNNHKDKTLIWVGNERLANKIPKAPNVHFVVKDSIESFKWLLKAQYMFCTQMHRPDLCSYNVFSGSKIIYFDHGIGGIKKWAHDAIDYDGQWEKQGIIKKIFSYISGESYPYSYFTVSSKKGGETYITALPYRGCTAEKLMRTGLPRNDHLIQMANQLDFIQEKKKEYAALLGFKPEQKVILYLPTFRRHEINKVSFLDMDKQDTDQLEKVLRKYNAVLLEKNHFVDLKRGVKREDRKGSTISVTTDVDVQEMYLFADIVISDYSGCFLDFILLDKPVIHFAYDLENYEKVDSGLYFHIEEFAAGRITFNFAQTIDEIDQLLQGNDQYKEKRKQIRGEFLEYETGNSCEKIYSILFDKDKE